MPKPKTILFVHSSDELYGADVILYNLLQGLDRTRFLPVVVLPTDVPYYQGQLSPLLNELNIPTYHIKMGMLRRMYFRSWRLILFLFYSLLGMWSLQRIIQRHQIDLIHSNTSAVINGALAARQFNIPHLWHIHEILLEPKWFVRRLNRFIVNNSDKIVCVSHQVAEQFAQYSKENTDIQIIWNALDIKKFSPAVNGLGWREKWTHQTDCIIFGVVGRVSHTKGQALFISAAKQVHKQIPNSLFFVIGSPIHKQENILVDLENLRDELGLKDNFHFIPFVENIPEIMRALDVLVLPSIHPESFGLVAVEAMASERPVIASAHGGVLEIIIPNETGLLIEPNSIGALTTAMLQLAQNADKRISMGKKGREHVDTYFSLNHFVHSFEEVYQQLLANTLTH